MHESLQLAGAKRWLPRSKAVSLFGQSSLGPAHAPSRENPSHDKGDGVPDTLDGNATRAFSVLGQLLLRLLCRNRFGISGWHTVRLLFNSRLAGCWCCCCDQHTLLHEIETSPFGVLGGAPSSTRTSSWLILERSSSKLGRKRRSNEITTVPSSRAVGDVSGGRRIDETNEVVGVEELERLRRSFYVEAACEHRRPPIKG
jgi:hypothetical protein